MKIFVGGLSHGRLRVSSPTNFFIKNKQMFDFLLTNDFFRSTILIEETNIPVMSVGETGVLFFPPTLPVGLF